MFHIGFPVDGGDQESSFVVLVRLVHGAEFHFCEGGRSSGLRKDSGADYVFSRFSEYIRREYRFWFELIPGLTENEKDISPENFCNAGTSDSVACALATNDYSSEEQDSPIILVSCSFIYKEQAYGLKSLKLQKVTKESLDKAKISLMNKWHAACQCRVLALVLHQHDANILATAINKKAKSLNQINFYELQQQDSPHLVSCAPDQWPLLKKKINKQQKYTYIAFMPIIVCCMLFLALQVWKFAVPVEKKKISTTKKETKTFAKIKPKKTSSKIKQRTTNIVHRSFSLEDSFYQLKNSLWIFQTKTDTSLLGVEENICYLGMEKKLLAIDLTKKKQIWRIKKRIDKIKIAESAIYLQYKNNFYIADKSTGKIKKSRAYKGTLAVIENNIGYIFYKDIVIAKNLQTNTKIWEFKVQNVVSELKTSQKFVFIKTQKDDLYALTKNGQKKWHHKFSQQIEILLQKNVLYCKSQNNLFFFTENGKKNKVFSGRVLYYKVINHILYLQSNSFLYFIDVKTNNIYQKIKIRAWQIFSIRQENKIVYCNSDQGIFAIENGKVKWQYKAQGKIDQFIVHKNCIYFITIYGVYARKLENALNYLYVINKNTGKLLWVFQPSSERWPGIWFSPHSAFWIKKQKLYIPGKNFLCVLPTNFFPFSDKNKFKNVSQKRTVYALLDFTKPKIRRKGLIDIVHAHGLRYRNKNHCIFLSQGRYVIKFFIEKVPKKLHLHLLHSTTRFKDNAHINMRILVNKRNAFPKHTFSGRKGELFDITPFVHPGHNHVVVQMLNNPNIYVLYETLLIMGKL